MNLQDTCISDIPGALIYGTKGAMNLSNDSYTVYDLEGHEIKTYSGNVEEANDLQAGGDISDPHINIPCR